MRCQGKFSLDFWRPNAQTEQVSAKKYTSEPAKSGAPGDTDPGELLLSQAIAMLRPLVDEIRSWQKDDWRVVIAAAAMMFAAQAPAQAGIAGLSTTVPAQTETQQAAVQKVGFRRGRGRFRIHIGHGFRHHGFRHHYWGHRRYRGCGRFYWKFKKTGSYYWLRRYRSCKHWH